MVHHTATAPCRVRAGPAHPAASEQGGPAACERALEDLAELESLGMQVKWPQAGPPRAESCEILVPVPATAGPPAALRSDGSKTGHRSQDGQGSQPYDEAAAGGTD